MDKEYLGYPIEWVDVSTVEYNDDVLYISAESIREGCPGWYAPPGHPNRSYLSQTGQFLRSKNGSSFTRTDHIRSKLLYKNLKTSIERDGLQSPLAAIAWNNPIDLNMTFPMKWPMWSEYWADKPHGYYWRVIQGCSRLLVLKDLGWEKIPIINITVESLKIFKQGKCPTRAWIDNEKKGCLSKYSAEHVGFMWDDAHSKDLKLEEN